MSISKTNESHTIKQNLSEVKTCVCVFTCVLNLYDYV